MKTISAALKTGFANGTIATCIKITRKDAVVLGFTDHDIELTFSGVTYKPTPGLSRVLMNLRSNAQVSNQEFASAWSVDVDEQDLQNGIYDEADVQVYRVDWSNLAAGSLNIFTGNLGLIQWTEDGFRADVQSLMKKLTHKIGDVTTAKCRHALFEPSGPLTLGKCGINQASHTFSSSVTAITTNRLQFDVAAIGQSNGWFANGFIQWTSGTNTGTESPVKVYATENIELFLPTNTTIQIGDTFDIFTGCDKNFSTCKNKFNNVVNFGGFPHINVEVNYK